jgi:hypothetical protein
MEIRKSRSSELLSLRCTCSREEGPSGPGLKPRNRQDPARGRGTVRTRLEAEEPSGPGWKPRNRQVEFEVSRSLAWKARTNINQWSATEGSGHARSPKVAPTPHEKRVKITPSLSLVKLSVSTKCLSVRGPRPTDLQFCFFGTVADMPVLRRSRLLVAPHLHFFAFFFDL